MVVYSHAYENSWRPNGNLLWGIAGTLWLIGALGENSLPGAIAASGGTAIAFTTPLFGLAFWKQSAYELDLKLAIINLTKEVNMGNAHLGGLDAESKENVKKLVEKTQSKLDECSESLKAHYNFSSSLAGAQIWIIGVSSLIWALGQWIGNYFFHCGELTC